METTMFDFIEVTEADIIRSDRARREAVRRRTKAERLNRLHLAGLAKRWKTLRYRFSWVRRSHYDAQVESLNRALLRAESEVKRRAYAEAPVYRCDNDPNVVRSDALLVPVQVEHRRSILS